MLKYNSRNSRKKCENMFKADNNDHNEINHIFLRIIYFIVEFELVNFLLFYVVKSFLL